ncbi:MAG: methyltransferase [Candidatus Amulumruptor caecigallinarius]|nr:methyltransferase [Candidatus Amulumruptor caecigallinarius]MCM1397117.1 methyltransferase [Candidatus Amulumruptor caecigallinarius]MCM1453927.1 methyltransferase [bacterium]
MKEREFRFKQFSIAHSSAAMKVGTDAVLLGAWAQVDSNVHRIADIGAGCGVIALMLAQRAPQTLVEAVEIDPRAAAEAESNVSISSWSERVSVTCADFAEWQPPAPVDLIVSNPPYFTETLQAPDGRRALARHAATLSPEILIGRARELLAPGGCLCMITPVRNADALEFAAASGRLNIERLTRVCTVNGKPPSRLLWQLRAGDCPVQTDTLTLRHADGTYTDTYLTLVKDFYLWLH